MTKETSEGRGLRADAVRSRARLLDSAVQLIARDGAGASLEAIARAAGVGSATLYRHFPTRCDLLEAIFEDRAAQLAQRADHLLASGSAGAFGVWFGELIEMANGNAGLTAVIGAANDGQRRDASTCRDVIAHASGRLLEKEMSAGRVRPDIRIDELLTLAMSISSLPTAEARARLRDVTIHGLSDRTRPS